MALHRAGLNSETASSLAFLRGLSPQEWVASVSREAQRLVPPVGPTPGPTMAEGQEARDTTATAARTLQTPAAGPPLKVAGADPELA